MQFVLMATSSESYQGTEVGFPFFLVPGIIGIAFIAVLLWAIVTSWFD